MCLKCYDGNVLRESVTREFKLDCRGKEMPLYAEGVYLIKYREEHTRQREQYECKALKFGVFGRFKEGQGG